MSQAYERRVRGERTMKPTAHLITAIALVSATAMAQPLRQPDPSDPSLPVPIISHGSAFADYQSFREQKPAPWQAVNDEISEQSSGAGHAGHAAANTTSASATTPPMTNEHAVHLGMEDPSKMNDNPMLKPPVQAAMPPSATAAQPTDLSAGTIAATGVVREVDKVNGKIKLTHEPIKALGWPQMTMFFRLKDTALADRVKAGDKVEFSLEKSGSGYVISGFQPAMAGHNMKPNTQGDQQ